MIRVEDVYKAYGSGERRVPALRGVSLELDGAGFFGIMGQSGSGKSTLLHLLAALDTPDRGRVEVGARRLDAMGEREATLYRRREIGIVFQQFNLIPTLTARENVELPGLLAGEDAAWLRARSGALLDRLGLTDRAEHRPEALSGGEQQRVAIGRALLYSPPLLLADEPTGALDSSNSERLWTLLGELAIEREMTIVMVTHEAAAAAHCRSVDVLSDGMLKGRLQTEGLDAGGVATRYQELVGTPGTQHAAGDGDRPLDGPGRRDRRVDGVDARRH